MKKLSSIILIICFLGIMYSIYCVQPAKKNIYELSKKDSIERLNLVVDSLRQEIFNLETQNGRYEITLQILKEEDSASAQKFEYILTTQTE